MIVGTLLRSLGHTPDAGVAPTTPTLSVVNVGDGDAVTATVDGDAGVTNRLYYRKSSVNAWTAGQSRVGDGTISQTGLDNNTTYWFVAVSANGAYYSLPSAARSLYVTDGASPTPADRMNLPLYYLQQTVAGATAFQTWTGTANQAAAAVRAYKREVVSPTRPCAVVSDQGGVTYTAEGFGSAHSFTDRGSLQLRFEDAIDTAVSQADSEETFCNQVGAVLDDMMGLAGTAGYLAIREMRTAQGPGLGADTNEANFHFIIYDVDWGP